MRAIVGIQDELSVAEELQYLVLDTADVGRFLELSEYSSAVKSKDASLRLPSDRAVPLSRRRRALTGAGDGHGLTVAGVIMGQQRCSQDAASHRGLHEYVSPTWGGGVAASWPSVVPWPPCGASWSHAKAWICVVVQKRGQGPSQ